LIQTPTIAIILTVMIRMMRPLPILLRNRDAFQGNRLIRQKRSSETLLISSTSQTYLLSFSLIKVSASLPKSGTTPKTARSILSRAAIKKLLVATWRVITSKLTCLPWRKSRCTSSRVRTLTIGFIQTL
jgi:hypothetical protein